MQFQVYTFQSFLFEEWICPILQLLTLSQNLSISFFFSQVFLFFLFYVIMPPNMLKFTNEFYSD